VGQLGLLGPLGLCSVLLLLHSTRCQGLGLVREQWLHVLMYLVPRAVVVLQLQLRRCHQMDMAQLLLAVPGACLGSLHRRPAVAAAAPLSRPQPYQWHPLPLALHKGASPLSCRPLAAAGGSR
jgi:hypothetical protein